MAYGIHETAGFLDPACRSAGSTLYGLSECDAAYEVHRKTGMAFGVADAGRAGREKAQL